MRRLTSVVSPVTLMSSTRHNNEIKTNGTLQITDQIIYKSTVLGLLQRNDVKVGK